MLITNTNIKAQGSFKLLGVVTFLGHCQPFMMHVTFEKTKDRFNC